jgi:hypothetical protein
VRGSSPPSQRRGARKVEQHCRIGAASDVAMNVTSPAQTLFGAAAQAHTNVASDSRFCAQRRGIEVRFHSLREQCVVIDSDLVNITRKMLIYEVGIGANREGFTR